MTTKIAKITKITRVTGITEITEITDITMITKITNITMILPHPTFLPGFEQIINLVLNKEEETIAGHTRLGLG